MEASNGESSPVFLDRTSRISRGKRMNKLLDEEIEDDDTFWNQDALKEEEEDNNYEEEPEAADEFDSDFDEDETEPDEEADNNDVDERPKKRLFFPGKTLAKRSKKKAKKSLSKLAEDDDGKDDDDALGEDQNEAPEEGVEGERIVRKSTRSAVVNRQAEREAIRAAVQATMRPIKKKKEGEEKRMSQEEMLLEAAQTEIMNLRNLERVLAREEEVKKRAIIHKAVYNGPLIRDYSKDGCSLIWNLAEEHHFSQRYLHNPFHVSNLSRESCRCSYWFPAKYRDPKTGLPYATKEAFKVLRQRFLAESIGVRKDMDMGNLCDALSGSGFLEKQKRSATPHNPEVSYSRQFACFRRIPSIEDDEDLSE